LETPLLKVSAEWHSQLDGCDTVTKIWRPDDQQSGARKA
jgi:hypothetical protein